MYKEAVGANQGTFTRIIKRAMRLTWHFKGISEQKNAYVRVFLHDGDSFSVLGWSSWEDDRTGEKLVLLVGNDRSIVTDSGNISKFEILYEKPKEPGAIGIKYGEGEIPAQGK